MGGFHVSRLVAVSNRVAVPRRSAAPGGLAVGLLAAIRSRGGLWFGWSGELTDDTPGPVTIARRQDVTYATTDLPRTEFDDYYGGFCNGALWPLFHYFVGAVQYSDRHFEAYSKVNRLFAERLLPLLHADDLLWVHDYHLIPLGQELRQHGVCQPIGFFLHTPFPHVEALRSLPRHDELVQQMLAYDLVGFQTARDLASFRSAVAELLGPSALQTDHVVRPGRRPTRIGVFPIGVDVEGIQREVRDSRSSETVRRMTAGLLGRRCVIGVDRLDYSKGLVDRFHAYERFMELHAEFLNGVTFLQIAPLSRTDLRAYSDIRRALEQAAGRINGRFAETDWTPIRYLNRNFAHEVLMGFLHNACVGVVTPMRDGMNLVAKEFVAAQNPADPGVLVLSTLAGAAEELAAAVQVNPRDAGSVGEAIHIALTMSRDERRARHSQMIEILRTNDIHAWHSGFIAELQSHAATGLPGMPLRALQSH
jgi:trehalose 6-phosphate synthase